MYTRICDECGQAFTTRYKQQRFCKRQHFRVCEICKNEFEVKILPCDTRTCSKKCAAEKSRKDGTLKIGREKAKQTMLKRYGVEHALQNPEFLAKKSKKNIMI